MASHLQLLLTLRASPVGPVYRPGWGGNEEALHSGSYQAEVAQVEADIAQVTALSHDQGPHYATKMLHRQRTKNDGSSPSPGDLQVT